jgi:hypothetical protein
MRQMVSVVSRLWRRFQSVSSYQVIKLSSYHGVNLSITVTSPKFSRATKGSPVRPHSVHAATPVSDASVATPTHTHHASAINHRAISRSCARVLAHSWFFCRVGADVCGALSERPDSCACALIVRGALIQPRKYFITRHRLSTIPFVPSHFTRSSRCATWEQLRSTS